MIPRPSDARPDSSALLPLDRYSHIIVAFSGGKDSTACALYLLYLGVPAERIELWHYCVDGAPSTRPLFDWPSTEWYCEAFARAFKMPLLFHWKEGGIEGEMLRNNEPTKPTTITLPGCRTRTIGGEGKPGTRLKYPQVAASLSARWCSAYVKIDVGKKVLANDPRFENAATLLITGERRQESKNRSLYAEVERDSSTTRTRRVDHWRSILSWHEREVWTMIRRYGVNPHPAYHLGWSRLSCMTCIFGDGDQWASVRAIAPEVFARMHAYERMFNRTINRKKSIVELADGGTPTLPPGSSEMARYALSKHYQPSYPILISPDAWKLPAGAFGHSGGPT